jgi:hypothetical protein
MLCEDVRRALPGGDEDTQLLKHTESCGECSNLAQAFEADARALSVFAADRELPASMSGFADSLMSRLANEPVVAAAPEGKVLRPNFNLNMAVAVAAVFAVAVALSWVLSTPQAQAPGFARTTPAPDLTSPEGHSVAQNTPATAPVDALPAPRRHERAPAPLRVRNPRGIVPVGGGRRDAGRGDLLDALRDLQRVFPNWDPSGMDRRVPRLKAGEREVRF